MHLRIAAWLLVFSVNLLCAATSLIKSTDGGSTWIDIDPGPPHKGVVDLQIAASRLYALTVTEIHSAPFGAERRDYSVLSSSDGGRTWRELDPFRLTRASAARLAVSPSDPQTVYIAYDDTDSSSPLCAVFPYAWALRRTTDGGSTATELRGNNEVLLRVTPKPDLACSTGALAVHPTIATTVLLGMQWWIDFDGIYFGTLSSVDGGGTWQTSSKIGFTPQLLAEPGEPSTLYARHQAIYTGRPHLAKSTDGGNEWAFKLSGVSSFAINPSDSAALLASRNDGSLWKSTDRAETWEHLGNWLPFDRLIVHPAKPTVVLAQAPALMHQALNTGDIFNSRDGGATWTVFPTGMDGFSFVFDPSDPGTIYGISEKRLEPRLRPPYIRNLAGGSTLAPGSLFSIYGDDLAGRVTFNGEPADLRFVSRNQSMGRFPSASEPGEVVVEVLRQPAAGPSLLDRQSITLSPVATPVILHDSVGGPHLYHLDSGRKITDADPARPGERIVVYCTGLGQPETRYVQFWPLDWPAAVQPVLFAEPVADQLGVHRVGIEVPQSLGSGSYLLVFWGGRNFARLHVR